MSSKTEKQAGDIRTNILRAASDLVRAHGLKALTQPRVAKLAGVRQSHLTYYFPRKTDLLLALFEDSHHQVAGHTADSSVDPMLFLSKLMFDQDRARFFFSTVMAAADSDDAELRAVVAGHMRGFVETIASHFGRNGDDPAIVAFVDLLRGMALRSLLEGGSHSPADVGALASLLGLCPNMR